MNFPRNKEAQNKENIVNDTEFPDTPDRVGEVLEKRTFHSTLKKTEDTPTHVSLRAFQVRFPSGLSQEFIAEIPANQDVVDVIAFRKVNEKIHIATIANVRPGPLVYESQISKHSQVEHKDFIELPAGIIRADLGESSLHDTASRIMKEKLGKTETNKIYHLGGARAHSIGKTTELTYPIAVEITNDSFDAPKENSEKKDPFHTWTKVQWRSLEDIVESYERGDIQDTRLMSYVFELAQKEKYELKLSNPLKVVENHASLPRGFRILDKGQLRQRDTPSKSPKIKEIPYKAGTNPFLSVHTFEIATESRDKTNTIRADVSYRKEGNDAMDFGAYIVIGGVPYMAITRQDRPNLTVREQEYHPIHIKHEQSVIQGISRVIDTGDTLQKKEYKASERLDGAWIISMQKIGTDFPIAGHSAERVERYLGEIGPIISPFSETIIVSVDDILDMAKRGDIIDSRLILNAHLIKAGLGYRSIEDFKEEDIEGFETLVRSGSKIFTQLASSENTSIRNLHIHLLKSPLYRRRILWAEQELGAIAMDFDHEKETGFFDASIPVFANPGKITTDNQEKYLLYLLHDFDHYRMGEFIPWHKDKSGNLVFRDRETYVKMMAWTEAEAVFFSDVVTPQMVGIERFEKIINPGNNPEIISLGRAFRDMKISDEVARSCIIEIERDGTIPDILKNHPRFQEFKNLFVDRMLRFHVLDEYQAGFEYEWWKKHENVARVMLRFATTSNDPKEFVKSFDASTKTLEKYHEGFNPLRAKIAQMINVDIRILALRIAYISDCSKNDKEVQRNAEGYLHTLEGLQKNLLEAKSRVQDTSISVNNLAIYTSIPSIKKEIEKIEKLVSHEKFTKNLEDFQKEQLTSRIFPYFKPYESLDPNEEPLKGALQKLKEKNGILE